MMSNLKNRLKTHLYGDKTDLRQLGFGSVYVFFSPQGGLFALLLMITFVTGVNYGNNLVLGFLFYLASIWLISVFMTFSHLVKLSVRSCNIAPVQAGDCAKIDIEILNKGNTARQVSVGFDAQSLNAQVPKTLFGIPLTKAQPYNSDTAKTKLSLPHTLTLPMVGDTATASVYLKTHKRGVFELPRLTISTVYPLGIMRAWAYARFNKKIAVYPAPLAFDGITHGQTGEQTTTAYVAGQDEFLGLDTYKEGESLARVSWRHLASGQGMLLKQFADPVGQALAVDYFLMPSALHEDKLANLAYLLLLLKNDDALFDFVLPSGKWQGSGTQFVDECLVKLSYEPDLTDGVSTLSKPNHPTHLGGVNE